MSISTLIFFSNHFMEISANFCTILEKKFLYLHFVAFVVSFIFSYQCWTCVGPSAGLRWCVNSKRKMCFFMISLLDMVPCVCLSLVTSGTFSLAQNIFLTNQRPWRALVQTTRSLQNWQCGPYNSMIVTSFDQNKKVLAKSGVFYL